MARLLLISNPAASGFTGGLHREVVRILRETHDVEAVWPTTPDQVVSLTEGGLAAGVDIIVAFGGDGIVHHIACRLRGTDTPLGIVPAGTTNVLARILGLPSRPRSAARHLAVGATTRLISTARLQGWSKEFRLDSCATFAAGMGLDAEVVAVAEQEPYRKYRFGSLHYARTAVAVASSRYRSRPPTLRISDGARVAFAVTALVQVHTPYTYFGRIPLTFDAETSGLTVLIMKEFHLARLPELLVRAARGGDLNRVKGVDVWTGVSSLEVAAEPAVSLQADGELIGLISELTVTDQPRALRVVAGQR